MIYAKVLKEAPWHESMVFTARLLQLNTCLTYFLPDRPSQLVTSLPDDDIKEILYHTMPNTWEKKMVEQEYNYLDGPNHSMAEFFEVRVKNLEKSIPPSVPSRNNRKRRTGSKDRKAVTFNNYVDSNKGHTGKKFCQYHATCGYTADQCTTLKALVKQAKHKRIKHFDKKKYGVKASQESSETEKRKHTEEVRAFKKMSVTDSDQESMNSSSSEEDRV